MKLTKSKQSLFIKILIILGIIVIGLYYWWYQEDIDHHGRLYPSKQKMCMEFAQSYLKTIKANEPIADFGGSAWNRAIAIESDLYNLCLSELTDEAMKEFKLNNIERYLEISRKNNL